MFGFSTGWKLHCVGSVRNSTAAIISVTSAQSAAEIDWPDGPAGVLVVLRPSSGSPIRSAQDASSASAWSANSIVGVW